GAHGPEIEGHDVLLEERAPTLRLTARFPKRRCRESHDGFAASRVATVGRRIDSAQESALRGLASACRRNQAELHHHGARVARAPVLDRLAVFDLYEIEAFARERLPGGLHAHEWARHGARHG